MQLLTDHVSLGILASLLAGTATGLGALPILVKADFSRRTLDIMLGLAAGVMLAASAFSLLVPAIELMTDWVGVTTAEILDRVGYRLDTHL